MDQKWLVLVLFIFNQPHSSAFSLCDNLVLVSHEIVVRLKQQRPHFRLLKEV